MALYDYTFSVWPQDMRSYDVIPTGKNDSSEWKRTVKIFFASMITNPQVGKWLPHFIYWPRSKTFLIDTDLVEWLNPTTNEWMLFVTELFLRHN